MSSSNMNGKAEGRWLDTSPCDNERTISLRKSAVRSYQGKSSELIPPGPRSRVGTFANYSTLPETSLRYAIHTGRIFTFRVSKLFLLLRVQDYKLPEIAPRRKNGERHLEICPVFLSTKAFGSVYPRIKPACYTGTAAQQRSSGPSSARATSRFCVLDVSCMLPGERYVHTTSFYSQQPPPDQKLID